MEQLLQSLRAVYDPLPAPALIAEPDGENSLRVVYRNPAAEKFLAGGEGDFIAAASEDIRSAATERIEKVWNGTLQGRHCAAQMFPYSRGMCLIQLWDVTGALKKQQDRIDAANAALKSALEAANAASKAKSDFLSNMSHDIRTPLNAIIGMTTIAQAHLDERDKLEDCLEKIDLSSRHLLSLINDILDMSRIESGKMTLNPEVFRLADFIHSLMAVFRPQTESKRQHLKLDFTGVHHEQLRGDQLRINQILINILSNAVKFTPEEGTISLRVSENEKGYRAGRNYSYYEFTVQDTGIGMSEEFLKHIFLPFERAESSSRTEGTGLGMTITHNLVEMMNGEMTVESREGEGSKFTVTLPLEVIESDESKLEELRGLRMLVADGSETSRRNLQEILGDLGMECDMCGNAWSASELAEKAAADGRGYFAVLLSWHLPVVDGIETCRQLRRILGNDLPIIIMSSYEWTMTADEMRKYGISEFIPKPIFRTRLSEVLYAYTEGGKASQAKSAEAERENFEGRLVMLVEDNEINREIGVELIEMLGASVKCAENGQEAVELFKNSPEGTYDLIFMDIQMPVMNGYAATQAIRALPRADSKTVPIVAMSANAFVEDIRACERAGMDDHVPKPVSMQQLSEAMKRHLSGRREV